MRRMVASLILALLFLGLFAFVFNVQPARAASGTIFINPDGSISSPVPANITTSDNVTYAFTGDNYLPVVVQRDNVMIDGKGWTLQGAGNGTGIDLSDRTKITVKNTLITSFGVGILLSSSFYFTLSGNNITANSAAGIWSAYSGDFWSSLSNTISENNITNNAYGIVMHGGGYTTISGNKITGNANSGIRLESSSCYNRISRNLIMNNANGISPVISENSISGNNITANRNTGINLDHVAYVTVSGNNITANGNYGLYGITLGGLSSGAITNTISGNNLTNNRIGIDFRVVWYATDNRFYHNNFINNTNQTSNYDGSSAPWDNGYPSGGNYWSDYNGTDQMGGPYQNVTGSDGICDAPYWVNVKNKDNYPFVRPSGWVGLPPFATFTCSPTSPDVLQSVIFEASAWAFNGAAITEYRWSFGDGNITATKKSTITHVYAYAMNFSVTLTVIDSNKRSLSLSQSVLVGLPSPDLSVSISPVSTTLDVSQSRLFTSSVSGGAASYSYQWHLNDSIVSGATNPTWRFTPTSAGSYTIYVNVVDSLGVWAKSNIAHVTVKEAPSVGGVSVSVTMLILTSWLGIILLLFVAELSKGFVMKKRK